MINKQNELNASEAAYSSQKSKITQDFEKIKTKVKINKYIRINLFAEIEFNFNLPIHNLG